MDSPSDSSLRKSWVGLIFFCLTSSFAVALTFAIVFATATLTFAGEQSPAQADAANQIYSGMISDSICMGRHDKASNLTAADCTRVCVKKGARYVLVDGDKTYLLKGSIAELNGFAGHRVEVQGTLSGDTIHFTKIGFLSE